tara:strand:+ start:227 stop:553 length:327 start_codon:yes stop_codon:yes gene_type:complete
MKFKKVIIQFLCLIFLYSCTGVQDVLEGKKRSENSDEFLVEKKNPLTVPPDMDELPVPFDQEEQKNNEDDSNDIKKVLQIEETQKSIDDSSNGDSKNLEQSILEKIKN